MTKLLVGFLVVFFSARLNADTLAEHYAKYGELFVVQLDSAPFPHPARAQGHTYDKVVYSTAEHYSNKSVGIFVPKGFRRTDHVDFVVHFHGWRHNIEDTLSEYKLIEQLVASGRNAILVVPVGADNVPDSFGGKMEDTNGFKHLMDDIVSTLQTRGIIGAASIGKIIVTGHSGGYRPVAGIVARGGLSDKVKEIWLLDAVYANTEDYLAWFKQYPKRRLIDIYTADGGTKGETEQLMSMMKDSKPPIPFLSKKETDLKPGDLENNRVIFIFSELAHDHVVYERNEYCKFLKTSGLASIKLAMSPKRSEQ